MESAFLLLADGWRIDLLRTIGAELDERQDQVARRAWHDLLNKPIGGVKHDQQKEAQGADRPSGHAVA